MSLRNIFSFFVIFDFVVSGVGSVFEDFIGRYSAYTSYRLYRQAIRERKETSTFIDDQKARELIEREKNAFFNYIILNFNHMHPKSVQMEIWELTLMLRRRGLSRSGMDVLQKYGMSISSKKYQEILQKEETKIITDAK